MLLSLLFISIITSSFSIHQDLFQFDDPLQLSNDPLDIPPPDPFLPDSNESIHDVTPMTVQLKHRDNRGISESDDIIDVPSSIDSYSSPLLSSSPDTYSSDSSSLIPSSDQYLSSSQSSSFSQPGPIIESGKFTLISSKLLRGSSIPSLNGPSLVQQYAFGAYHSAGSQSYVTGTQSVPSSSYSISPSLPIPSSIGSNYGTSQEGYNTGVSGVQLTSYPSNPQSYTSGPAYVSPSQGYVNGGQFSGYDGYSTYGSTPQNYATASQQGYNDGVYHLNGPIQGRRVVIYKKILRPVRVHTYVTVERLPGGKVVDQWAEGGYSSDLLNGQSSINAPLFTPINGGFYSQGAARR